MIFNKYIKYIFFLSFIYKNKINKKKIEKDKNFIFF